MCGIAGYLAQPSGERGLSDRALLSGLRHRGPDAEGQLGLRTRAGCSGRLFATRLAILDLSAAGQQPMTSRDGRFALVFNGEIYNHAALRTELAQAGAVFRGGSDTEAILVGYEQLGDALWPRLRGMFALALWDARDEELRLVRDPLGQKPLYYVAEPAEDGLRRLCFASELRALLSAGAVPPRIDAQALLGYLTWGSVPEPGTVVAGVQALPPGHLLRLRVGGDRLRLLPTTAYVPTEPEGDPQPTTQPQAVELLRETLADTLRGHLTADVPVGVLLSGGIDSTSVAAWARAVAPHAPLAAFTLATDAPGMADELARARDTARALRLQHEVWSLSAEAAAATVPDWLSALDQPSLDGYNTFLICARVRAAGLKVVLSGAGGDELFFGYGLHRRFARAWAAYRRLPDALQQAISDERYAAWLYELQRRLFPPAIRRLLLHPSICFNEPHPSGPQSSAIPDAAARIDRASPWAEGLSRVQAYERRLYLRHTLLRDGDVLSMAHGVELRLPFCDPGLWDVARALRPWSYAENKGLLVAAAPVGDTRVAAAAAHPKRGFELPLDDWLRGPLANEVGKLLLDRDQVAAAGLQPTSLRRLWQLHGAAAAAPLAVRRRLAHRVWALYVWLAYVQRQALSLAEGR
ncbi:MAG TPA: asparagine synthase (glutamine-hydrolyzing) [Pseudomonadota bacterium]|nr:asparagine synthase (glutamine-hydrolyzing) [Pseudomonadota bacterium]